jgi:KamA family protein
MPSVTFRENPARGAESDHALPNWRDYVSQAVRCPQELCRVLRLPAILADEGREASRAFPLLAPRGYLARMRPADPHDPLLLQILPRAEECRPVEGFSGDPVGECQSLYGGAMLKKYHGRALLVATGQCAVHCRFCFRRHFPYASTGPETSQAEAALERIAQDPTIREVILSGGDPLMLDDAELAAWAARLAGMGHVRRLRVHTRLPIVIPERVTDELLEWLRATRLTPIVVVHVNHPAELAPDVARAPACRCSASRCCWRG